MSFFLRTLGILIVIGMLMIAGIQYPVSGWPSVRGTVKRGNWASEQGGSADGVVNYGNFIVLYSYDVDGIKYERSLLSFHPHKTAVPILSEREEIVRQPRPGDEVRVYYFPYYAGLSVLIPEMNPNLWLWGVISLLAAIGCFIWSRIFNLPI
jgi:hypothetical protein